MSESVAVESVEVESVEEVSPGSRAVAAMPSIPDVPKALTDSKNPFAKAMVGGYRSLVGMARDAAAVLQRYAQGTAELDANLKSSDEPTVVAYRQAVAQSAEAEAAAKATFEADIADFKAKYDAELERIAGIVADAKTPAVATLGGQIGVTPEERAEAISTYKAAADAIKSNNALLKKQGIDLGTFSIPALKTGGKGNRGTGDFRPRFGVATVDGNPVNADKSGKVTPVAVAAAAGTERDFLVKCLLIQALNSDRSVFDTAAPHTEFRFESNGHSIWVTKGERKSPAANADSADVDDDDDDDDSDETESE